MSLYIVLYFLPTYPLPPFFHTYLSQKMISFHQMKTTKICLATRLSALSGPPLANRLQTTGASTKPTVSFGSGNLGLLEKKNLSKLILSEKIQYKSFDRKQSECSMNLHGFVAGLSLKSYETILSVNYVSSLCLE